MDNLPRDISQEAGISHIFPPESCSAHGLLLKTAIGTPLKTMGSACGAAVIGSACPGMLVLSGGVDGGGVGVGVRSQEGVVLGAEHVKQATVST